MSHSLMVAGRQKYTGYVCPLMLLVAPQSNSQFPTTVLTYSAYL